MNELETGKFHFALRRKQQPPGERKPIYESKSRSSSDIEGNRETNLAARINRKRKCSALAE